MLAFSRLLAAWLTLFIVGTDLFVISPLIPAIAADFQIDTQSTGFAVTAFSLGYVIAAPVFGRMADRFGRRRILVLCLVVFSAANFLTALTAGLSGLMAARLLCGISAAGITPSIYALVGAAAPEGRRATWISIVLTGLLSSLPLGAAFGTWISESHGWACVFAALAVTSHFMAPINLGLWPQDRRGNTQTASAGLSAAQLIPRLLPTIAWATALYGVYIYLGAGLASIGFDPDEATRTVIIYGAAGFAGALLGGRIADRLGAQAAIRISLGGMGAGLLLLSAAIYTGMGIAAALGIVAVTAQVFFPAQQALLLKTFSTRAATALSWNNSALFTGISLGSLIGGQTITVGGFILIPLVSTLIVLTCFAYLCRPPRGWSLMVNRTRLQLVNPTPH